MSNANRNEREEKTKNKPLKVIRKDRVIENKCKWCTQIVSNLSFNSLFGNSLQGSLFKNYLHQKLHIYKNGTAIDVSWNFIMFLSSLF